MLNPENIGVYREGLNGQTIVLSTRANTMQKRTVKTHIAILRAIIDEHNHSIDMSDAREAIETLRDSLEDDFTFDFDGNEYRIISDDAIWSIYRDEIQNLVEECYELKLDSIPDFVAFNIDWEQTAKNAYDDGYGHTFSGYDGSEVEAAGYWVFRTN